MPAYNSEKYISQAIESVLNQSYTKWELIIINDCSTDNTEQIIKKYQQKYAANKKIKLITLTQNKGVANARNIGIKNAKGRFLAFLDSDDYWEKEKLEEQIKYMEVNEIYFSYHDYNLLNITRNKVKRILVPSKLNYRQLLKGNRTGSCLTVCLDRRVIDKIIFTNEKHEDYICWLNILKTYDITAYGINKVLGTYRIGKKSVSSNKLKSAIWNWRVYRETQRLSIIKSFYYMFFYIYYGIKKYF